VKQSVEPGYGVFSAIALLKWLPSQCPEFSRLLEVAASEPLPYWLSTPFGGAATQPENLVAHLARTLVESSTCRSVESIVDAFASAVESRSVRLRLIAHLENHTLLPTTLHVVFANNVVFRYLDDDELQRLLNVDVLDSTQLDPFSNRTVLEWEFEVPLFISARDHCHADADAWPEAVRPIDDVHVAMHCFKAGSTPVAIYRIVSVDPALQVGGLTIGRRAATLAHFNLEQSDLAAFKAYVDNCLKVCRPNLALAKSRLRDAEARYSPVDAIVDAFVGVEALLNSDNVPELTMRVALNYATLSPPNRRHHNYRRLKDLYKVRSRIVHGDFKPGSSYKVDDSSLNISEVATISKELLRELIHAFVANDELRIKAKLDVPYWEQRYFAG
jgi:hypothetical protein